MKEHCDKCGRCIRGEQEIIRAQMNGVERDYSILCDNCYYNELAEDNKKMAESW